MAAKLICPDCGGTIGEPTSSAEVPCTCVAKPVAPTLADYKAATAPATEDLERDIAGEPAKACRVCGKDVTGQKRYKDSLGYWCVDCHRAEKEGRTAGQKRCTECGRLFPVEKLIESDDERLCYTCNRNRNAQRREILKKAAKGRIYKLYEMRQLMVLLGVFLLLLLIIVAAQLGWIGSGG